MRLALTGVVLLAAGCMEHRQPAEGSDRPGLNGEGRDQPGFGRGRIHVWPPELDFGELVVGEPAERPLAIKNIGWGDLTVMSIDLLNSSNAAVEVDFSPSSPHRALPATLPPRVTDGEIHLLFSYSHPAAGEEAAQVGIRSTDEETPFLSVPVEVRIVTRCAEVDPDHIDFREVIIGTAAQQVVHVRNCGDADLMVSELTTVEGPSLDFTVTPPEGLDTACTEDRDQPCTGEAVIPGHGTLPFAVQYAPPDEGADGGRVDLTTNVPGSETMEVGLFGRGTNGDHPSCVAEARPAGVADWGVYDDLEDPLVTALLSTVELTAAASLSPASAIVGYGWTVLERPDDSAAQFAPHDRARDVTFFLDAPGRYVFELEVTGSLGGTSNPNCLVVVEAVPVHGFHVQLVWDTPGDPDQTDTGPGAASDLDLHLLRSPGAWFCAPADCHAGNPDPDWGVPLDAADDPSLSEDLTDGAGPENIDLDGPEDGVEYRLGVHYADDAGFGPSFATVRVFIDGVLRLELANQRLAATDAFWEVATIDGATGAITPVDSLSDAPPREPCP